LFLTTSGLLTVSAIVFVVSIGVAGVNQSQPVWLFAVGVGTTVMELISMLYSFAQLVKIDIAFFEAPSS